MMSIYKFFFAISLYIAHVYLKQYLLLHFYITRCNMGKTLPNGYVAYKVNIPSIFLLFLCYRMSDFEKGFTETNAGESLVTYFTHGRVGTHHNHTEEDSNSLW